MIRAKVHHLHPGRTSEIIVRFPGGEISCFRTMDDSVWAHITLTGGTIIGSLQEFASVENAPLQQGEEITIRPEYQDPGDGAVRWFVYRAEYDGRVGIYTPVLATEWFTQPWQLVDVKTVERTRCRSVRDGITPGTSHLALRIAAVEKEETKS